jgi:hypothetical protein
LYSRFYCCNLQGKPFFQFFRCFLILSWPSSESDSALLLLVHKGTNILPDSQQLHSCTSSSVHRLYIRTFCCWIQAEPSGFTLEGYQSLAPGGMSTIPG